MIAAAVALSAGGLAPAASASEDETARRLVEMQLSQIDMVKIGELLFQQYEQAYPDRSESFYSDLHIVVDTAVTELASFPQALGAIALDYYVETFTGAELQQILDFYSTDAGRKILATSPQFGVKLSSTLVAAVQKAQPKIEARVKSELLKRGHAI